MTRPILEKYRQIPHSPGVYLMKDVKDKIIYVGKASDLKKRLSAYFIKKNNHDAKTLALIEMIKDLISLSLLQVMKPLSLNQISSKNTVPSIM